MALLPPAQEGVPLRHAIEARHESLDDPAFFDLAREAGVAVAFADSPKYPRFEEQTGPFTYARLQDTREEVETGYDDGVLDAWAEKAKRWAAGGREVFVFFIAGAKARNPAAAQALIARLR
jgi:uncharacterized protein YecE (DUF72 family)